jgi:hypothetical protein
MIRMAEDANEIAELEARLAELKAAEAAKAAAEAEEAAERQRLADEAARRAAGLDDNAGFDFATLSSRKKVAATRTSAPNELLSESWKEADSAGEGGGLPVLQIVGALAVAIGLIAFAQVPIGEQNLDPVTYGGKASRVESPDEIKARFAAVVEE